MLLDLPLYEGDTLLDLALYDRDGLLDLVRYEGDGLLERRLDSLKLLRKLFGSVLYLR